MKNNEIVSLEALLLSSRAMLPEYTNRVNMKKAFKFSLYVHYSTNCVIKTFRYGAISSPIFNKRHSKTSPHLQTMIEYILFFYKKYQDPNDRYKLACNIVGLARCPFGP